MTARIEASNTRSVVDAIAFLVVIILLVSVFGMVGYWRHVPALSASGAILFVLSLIVGIPIMRRDRALRRCHPALVLDITPVPIGGKLTGNIEFAADNDILTRVKAIFVNLRWLRRSPHQSLSRTVWNDAKEFPPGALRLTSGGLAVPVAFDIPANAQATGDVSLWGLTAWRVDVRAEIRGGTFKAMFEVPVARSGEAA